MKGMDGSPDLSVGIAELIVVADRGDGRASFSALGKSS